VFGSVSVCVFVLVCGDIGLRVSGGVGPNSNIGESCRLTRILGTVRGDWIRLSGEVGG
jgi:hypothetical protein